MAPAEPSHYRLDLGGLQCDLCRHRRHAGDAIHACVRFAVRARDVQPRADMLARRLGLRSSPAVWFVPAFVSPMLWSLGGRPRLLLPKGLWDRLDIAGRDAILLHELAHWSRGDHLVRWIELLATCLYWWHPACWWAQRELREAEEQCCDAWVLWALPGVFKNYANALLEAVEFASIGADRPSVQTAVPVLASRMGQFVHLRRRLTMLKHGNIAAPLLGRPGWRDDAGLDCAAACRPRGARSNPPPTMGTGRPAASPAEVAPARSPERTAPSLQSIHLPTISARRRIGAMSRAGAGSTNDRPTDIGTLRCQ